MSNNGLRSFGFHTQDEDQQSAADVLRVGRPSFAAFATTDAVTLAGLDAETAARQYLQHALASEAVPELTAPEVDGRASEFKTLGSETLALTGTKTVKFRQTYDKIPVYGSLVTVELDEQNELLTINSSLGEPAGVNPVAKISPTKALTKVRQLAGYGRRPLAVTPRLCYYFDTATDGWRLVYLFEDVHKLKREPSRDAGRAQLLVDYLIDAHDGDLVAELPRTPNVGPLQVRAKDGLDVERDIWCVVAQDGSKTLRDSNLNVHTYDFKFQDIDRRPLPGGYVGNPPDPWHPGAVSAHANAVTVAAFLRDVLRRNGIDNVGGPLISSVNCIVANESPDGRQWGNAAWVDGQMVYGQRRDSSGRLRSYAVGLDVVGHEIFHGVTDRTSRLQYAAESGALNESYSDIFGVVVSNWTQSDLSKWNWQMGEDVEGTGIPLRDLSQPEKHRQPAHMRNYRNLPVTEEGNWGGVHINSGIHNKAAYNIMTAKDGRGRHLFDAVAFAALFYLTLTQHLSRTSRFSDSRRGVELVARTLFRRDAAAARNAKLQAITRAFDAVGIQ